MKGKTKQVLLSLTAVAVFSLFSAVNITAQQSDQQMMTTQKQTAKKPRAKKRTGAAKNAGVPKGVQKCLDRLIELANAEPMPPYEGQPQKIVSEGLMWNDEKSNCSIGTDQALRLKVFEMSNAWQTKDAAKVRSLLAEIKSAAPQG